MNEEIEEMAVIGCVRNPQAHTADEYAAIKEKAVKKFADEIKAKLNAIFGKTICSDLDTEDITDIIDELLKEYENGKDKD